MFKSPFIIIYLSISLVIFPSFALCIMKLCYEVKTNSEVLQLHERFLKILIVDGSQSHGIKQSQGQTFPLEILPFDPADHSESSI